MFPVPGHSVRENPPIALVTRNNETQMARADVILHLGFMLELQSTNYTWEDAAEIPLRFRWSYITIITGSVWSKAALHWQDVPLLVLLTKSVLGMENSSVIMSLRWSKLGSSLRSPGRSLVSISLKVDKDDVRFRTGPVSMFSGKYKLHEYLFELCNETVCFSQIKN